MAKPKKQIDELKDALGDEMSPAERAYLEKLESSLKGQVDYDDPEQVEAEIRRREQERIAKNFKPRAPLYRTAETGDTQQLKPRREEKQSYQNDPRYREYYDRLRKQREAAGESPDEVEPMTMDDLDRHGYDAAVVKGKPARAPRHAPAPAPAPAPRASTDVTTSIKPGRAAGVPPTRNSSDYVSGSILRLDDGSVAIYKDAVSGKDYALMYFLEPDSTVAPRGIFLKQYDSQHIGHLPEPLFAEMREQGTWDRDAVIFHLERYEFAGFVRQVAAHQEGRKPGSAPSSRPAETTMRDDIVREDQETLSDVGPAEPPKPKDVLERGRVLRINVGGKVWESVYWTSDEMGSIVAHNTHKDWSLMHLDLNRFKDSIEYGELLGGTKLQEIEQSLVKR